MNRMMAARIRGVDFIVMNTDVQALHHNLAPQKLHIGKSVTRGLGSGMDPELGRKSAEESQNDIREMLKDADMVFITCGLGGGTGSGASPVVAEVARECGALVVGVVTKPFSFEGPKRSEIADAAWEKLSRSVDTIITIQNDRIKQVVDKKTSFLDAFRIADDVLRQGVQGISEIITMHGVINVDFADVKTIMKDTGSALMGIGMGSGENRSVDAAKAAISSPLLEISIDGARGILFTVTGGPDLSMSEVEEAAKLITTSASDDVKVIFGAIIDEAMGDNVKVTVIATGFDDRRPKPFVNNSAEDESTSSLFSSKFSPSPFLRKTIKEEEEEDRKFKQFSQNSPVPQRNPSFSNFSFGHNNRPAPIPPPQAPSSSGVDEDLEIPAFLRKKMGS